MNNLLANALSMVFQAELKEDVIFTLERARELVQQESEGQSKEEMEEGMARLLVSFDRMCDAVPGSRERLAREMLLLDMMNFMRWIRR